MARKLDGLVLVLKQYHGQSSLPINVSYRLEGLATYVQAIVSRQLSWLTSADFQCPSAINLQRSYIEGKIERGLLQRVLQAPDDVIVVVRTLRTIAHLVDIFLVRPIKLHLLTSNRLKYSDRNYVEHRHQCGGNSEGKPDFCLNIFSIHSRTSC
jgi:hypothetical protein